MVPAAQVFSSVEVKFLDWLNLAIFPAYSPCCHWIFYHQFPVSAMNPRGSRKIAAAWKNFDGRGVSNKYRR